MNDDKTEKPTDHRIKKVRKEGKIKFSRELNSFVMLIIGLFSLCFYKDFIIFKMFIILSSSLQFNCFTINDFSITDTLDNILKFDVLSFFITISYPILAVLIVAKMFSGISFNFRLLKLNMNKLNIIQGFKKIFSYQIFPELLKTILKISLVVSVSTFYLCICFSCILALILMSLHNAIRLAFHIMKMCFLFSILSLIPIVIFDIYFQSVNYYKQLKMSRQEVKDEFKQMEGNPYLKSRIRQVMRTFAHRKMIADIKNADVIIINPTSYAVALIYNDKTMFAPQVLAKGIDDLALIIRKQAQKNCIPILSAPFLARTLYLYTKIGESIPTILYKLVAEVLAWVWKVREWKKNGGVFPESPKELFIPLKLGVLKKDKNND